MLFLSSATETLPASSDTSLGSPVVLASVADVLSTVEPDAASAAARLAARARLISLIFAGGLGFRFFRPVGTDGGMPAACKAASLATPVFLIRVVACLAESHFPTRAARSNCKPLSFLDVFRSEQSLQ
ncbi:hypothetical protein PC119_g22663 [Phytophthora cactorum]|nr:hypothetical protein PC119_g22663 [Phytophthora cactorum]